MNIPKKWAPTVSRLCDASFYSPERVRRQAVRGSGTVPCSEAISVAISHYNRGRSAYRPLCNLLDNEFIREVVFFDDGSQPEELAGLGEFVASLGVGDKIRIEGRRDNRGAQTTKLDAIAACRCEWVLVLDSDNTVFRSYLHALRRIPARCSETIYGSPFAFPYFSFRPFAGRKLDFEACAELTRDGVLRRVLIINDGNYLVHRDTYLRRIGPLRALRSDVADVMLANYLWLSEGGFLQVLESGSYHHRIDGSSFWMRTAGESRERVMELFSRFAANSRWDEPFAEKCLRI